MEDSRLVKQHFYKEVKARYKVCFKKNFAENSSRASGSSLNSATSNQGASEELTLPHLVNQLNQFYCRFDHWWPSHLSYLHINNIFQHQHMLQQVEGSPLQHLPAFLLSPPSHSILLPFNHHHTCQCSRITFTRSLASRLWEKQLDWWIIDQLL